MANDELLPEMNDEEIEESSLDFPIESESGMDSVEFLMDRFLDAADVSAVYGEPIEKGETIIIPVAEVVSILGFGLGEGSGEGPEGQGGGTGSGGGGGGWNISRPVAIIVASPEGVRVEPVIDVTKVAIAALTTVGFMFGLIFRMLKPRH